MGRKTIHQKGFPEPIRASRPRCKMHGAESAVVQIALSLRPVNDHGRRPQSGLIGLELKRLKGRTSGWPATSYRGGKNSKKACMPAAEVNIMNTKLYVGNLGTTVTEKGPAGPVFSPRQCRRGSVSRLGAKAAGWVVSPSSPWLRRRAPAQRSRRSMAKRCRRACLTGHGACHGQEGAARCRAKG